MKNINLCLLGMLFCFPLFASDLISVRPLTNRILMLHFKDGKVIHHQQGQKWEQAKIEEVPLNVTAATSIDNYTLSSSDDSNYSSTKKPSRLGQKSKGQGFIWLCADWQAGAGCRNLNVTDHTKEHWIYLFLPNPLQKGKTYELNTGALAKNGNTWKFIFDETVLHSEAIHVNNVGYMPTSKAKYAYLYHWMGTAGAADLKEFSGKNFQVWDTDKKQAVFTGTIAFRRTATNQETGQASDSPGQNFLGTEVYEMNFSNFNTPGNYRIVVDGVGASFPFKIARDAYFEPFYWVMKGLYQQRSGIELKAPFTDQPRPAPHNPTLTPGFAGKLRYTSTRLQDLTDANHSDADKPKIEAGFKGPIDTWGWYQDAGDWDGYFEHTRVPIELMFLYEAAPHSFPDRQLNIPESGNGLPDLLDEARWLLRYHHRTRKAMQDKGYGTGGVAGGRVAGDWFGSDTKADGSGQGSWEDVGRTWAVLGEDVFMSFRYAGMAAHFAHLLKFYSFQDPEKIDWEKEAEEVYTWAARNLKSADFQAPHGLNVYQNRLYATGALYRLTGKAEYHTQFLNDLRDAKNSEGRTVYSDAADLIEEWRFPAYLYMLMPASRAVQASTLQMLRNASNNSASNVMTTVEQRACRWGGNYWFPMLVGQATTPMVSTAAFDWAFSRRFDSNVNKSWLEGVQTTADYFLGANPLNMTWITGVGERSPEDIFCIDSWYLGNQPRKGIVPYGPWRNEAAWREIGPWLPSWGNKTVTPGIDQWPGHERWWNNRITPLSAEYTIHQNLVTSASIYGFLAADLSKVPNWDTPNVPTPVRELKPDEVFKVYPNPGNGQFRIEVSSNLLLEVNALDLSNASGQVVYSQQVNTNASQIQLQLEHLPAGMYFLRLNTPQGFLHQKLLISKR
jgi:endoglucanase